MADINLDPQATRAAARRLSDCGAELLASRRTTGGNLESMNSSRPWGRDELGDIFTRRYEDAAQRALDAWRKAAERVSELGSHIDQATSNTVETDRLTSEVIDKIQ